MMERSCFGRVKVISHQRFPRLRMRFARRFHPLCWIRDAIIGRVSTVRVLR